MLGMDIFNACGKMTSVVFCKKLRPASADSHLFLAVPACDWCSVLLGGQSKLGRSRKTMGDGGISLATMRPDPPN